MYYTTYTVIKKELVRKNIFLINLNLNMIFIVKIQAYNRYKCYIGELYAFILCICIYYSPGEYNSIVVTRTL